MQTLIIYTSIHHDNTEKVARAMAEVLHAKLAKSNDVNINELIEYDLIGFGSGIYFRKHHRVLLNLVDKLPKVENKKAFIFSTSGVREMWFFHEFNKPLEEKLFEKELHVIGEFSCRGFDTYGVWKCIGGISKGRPNEKDLQRARNFAQELLEKLPKYYGI